MKKQREVGPDLIRSLAIACVICGHFFSVNTPYNSVEHVGGWMFLQSCMKAVFCNLGVPLFLMLSGYFNCRKEFSLQYVKNIKRILVPYAVISLLTWSALSSRHSLSELFLGTLGFTLIEYAWYVEMFIGLYLLTPFINIVLDKVFGSSTPHMRWGLFAILIFMTSLPPMLDRGRMRLIPNYWQACFPILLYVTGAYIRFFQPVIKRKYLALIGVAVIYLQYPTLNQLKMSVLGGGELPNLFGPYYALPNYIAMTLLFVLLYRQSIKNRFLKKMITSVSLVSYEMFLFSFLCDQLIYPLVMSRYYTTQSEFTLWFFPLTLTSIICSFLLAKAYKGVEQRVGRINCFRFKQFLCRKKQSNKGLR